jgi:hypothetical protein
MNAAGGKGTGEGPGGLTAPSSPPARAHGHSPHSPSSPRAGPPRSARRGRPASSWGRVYLLDYWNLLSLTCAVAASDLTLCLDEAPRSYM